MIHLEDGTVISYGRCLIATAGEIIIYYYVSLPVRMTHSSSSSSSSSKGMNEMLFHFLTWCC